METIEIAISLTPYYGLKRGVLQGTDKVVLNCNFSYSLLGIETGSHGSPTQNPRNCNFSYSLLGIETTGTRDRQR